MFGYSRHLHNPAACPGGLYMTIPLKHIITRTLKWISLIVAFLLILIIGLFLLIQTRYGQDLLRDQAVRYLSKKMETKLALGRIDLDLRKGIRLSNLLIEDREKRTLAKIGLLDVQIDWLSLLSNQASLHRIELSDADINIFRKAGQENFSFSFIPEAFLTSPVETEKVKDSTAAFLITLGKIDLADIRFKMDDQQGKQIYDIALGSLKTDLTKSDIAAMYFRADHFHTRDITANVSMWGTDGSTHPDSSGSINMRLMVDTASMERTVFHMEQQQGDVKIQTKAALLTTSSLSVDLNQQLATSASLCLKDHATSFEMVSKPVSPEKQTPASSSKPFRFYVDTVAIVNNGFEFHNNALKPAGNRNAIDPNHLRMQDINIHLGATSFDGQSYRSRIRMINGTESTGFTLKQVSGDIEYADSQFQAKDLLLQTKTNRIMANVLVGNMQAALTEQISVNGTITTNALQLQELLFFQPELAQNKYFVPLVNKRFDLNTRFNGTVGNLNIPSITLKESATTLSASANVFHVTDPGKMIIKLKLDNFSSGRKDILSFLPKGLISDSLQHYIPEKFSISGSYNGTVENFNTDLRLSTSLGNAKIKGSMKNVASPSRAVYNMTTTLNGVDLGRILEDSTIGKVSGTFQARGRGLELSTAVANATAHISKASYRGYEYTGIDVEGEVDKGMLNADIKSADPNLDMDGTISMVLHGDPVKLDADLNIRNLDLRELHVMEDSLIVKGEIKSHFSEISGEKLDGELHITNSQVIYNQTMFALDSIGLTARHTTDSQYIDLVTPYAELSLNGRYNPESLPDAFRKIYNKYAVTGNRDTIFEKPVQASFNMSVNIPDSIAVMVKGLKSVSPFGVNGLIDSEKDELDFYMLIPLIRYQDLEVDSVSIFANTSGPDDKDLEAGIQVIKVRSPSYELNKTNAGFIASEGKLDGSLIFRDQQNEPRYRIPFTFTNDPARPYIQISDSLLVDKKPWSVSNDNRIYLDPENLEGSTIALTYKNSKLSLNAMGNEPDGLPLELDIRDFDISDVADILISDTSLATGIINGKASLHSFSPLSFTTSIKADSLSVYGAKLGSLSIDVNNPDTGMLAIRSSLIGETGKINVSGTYATDAKQADIDVDINELHLAHAEPFVNKYLMHLDGRVSGGLKVKGSVAEPQVLGKLEADSVETIYTMTATYLRIPKATFTFNEEGILFDQLDFEDSVGHKGKLSGQVNTKNYRDYAFNLNLKADSFEVVGRKKIADQGIYGPTTADLNITMTGTPDHMSLQGKVNIIDRSEFTYVYRSETRDEIGEGLIEFFDPSKPIDTAAAQTNSKKRNSTLDMNLYINITPSSTVTVITDEVSGDHLKAKGKADLNYLMKAGGEMELLGTYTLEGGEYDLSLGGLVRRSFKIEKGSTINWSGDPTKGRMDITAKYQIKTPAAPLLNDISHIPGIDKQKLNFDVMILLKKELLKPDISFRLDMPEAEQEAFDGMVYSRIKQVNAIPAELNKQVMGLLAFGQFIAENPFNSMTSAGGDFQTQAFNTAGKLLTQELTNLVGRYIKEVNIDFGLEKAKDYTTGQEVNRTDLKVGVSKSFANNRLNIYVGSNFLLEGANQNQDAISGLAGDITLEYMLTPDSKYRLKAFRLTDNELVFQGNVVRTGLSFMVVLEFNQFRNMFKTREQKKKKPTKG